jgi:hypothetical protein
MKFYELLEIIVGILIVIIISTLFISHLNEEVSNEPIIVEDTFNEHPLLAWGDTDKKGNVVKIRYRVSEEKTFVEVVNVIGEVVHTQPFQRSPWPDGRTRDFTYTWTLYYTQDYGEEIPPGDYEIRVCHINSKNIYLRTWITI